MSIKEKFLSMRNYFKREKPFTEVKKEVAILNGNNSLSLNWFSSIYQLPEIRTAINTVAEIFSTVPIWHKRENNKGEIDYPKSDIFYVLNWIVNPAQCKTQFWVTVVGKLLKDNNSAIQIVYDKNYKVDSIYPLPYRLPKFDKLPYIYFEDDSTRHLFEKQNIILLNRFSTFLGGTQGQATSLYEAIITAFQKRAAKNATDPSQINGALKKLPGGMEARVKAADHIAGLKEIRSQQGDGANVVIPGLVTIPSGYDLVDMKINDIQIDREMLNDVINAVYNYFGISKEIINGTASEIQWQQLITKTFKPLAKQCSEAFTKTIFSKEAIYKGNEIEFDYHELDIATLNSKMQLFANGTLNGYLNIDEARDRIGLPPLPNGLGAKYRANLNTVDIAIVDQYQLSKSGAAEKTSIISAESDGGVSSELIEDVADVTKKPLLVGQLESLASIIAGYQSGIYTFNQAKSMLKIGVGLTEAESIELLDKQK